MHSLVSLIGSYCLNSLWCTPLFWVTGSAACMVMKRLGFQTTHKIWVLVLFAAVFVPSLPIAFAAFHEVMARASWSGGAVAHTNANILTTWSAISAYTPLPHHLLGLLTVVHLSLVVLLSARLMWRISMTSGLLRRARPGALTPVLESIRQEVTRCFGVDPCICETDEVPGPVVVGIRKPVLLLPSGFLQATGPDDFRVAVAHECAHVSRGDFLKHLVYQFLSLPIAFHPVTRLIQDQIAQSRELLCDQLAVQRSVNPRVYVQSLLRLAMLVASSPQTSAFNTVGISDADILEKRVMELRNSKSKATTVVRLCLLSAGFLLFGAATLTGVAAPIASTGIEAPQAKHGERVSHVGKDVVAPVLIRQVDPEFPATYRKRDGKMSETCEVALIVSTSGTPREVHALRSFKNAFDEAAVKAVQQYRFKPGLHEGKPVPVALLVKVNFQKF